MSGWRLRLRATSAALLGGVAEREPGVHAASGLLPGTDGAPRTALLLGSSLRGVLRHDARRLASARALGDCAGDERCACTVCALFGAAHRPGKLAVRSATAPAARLAAVAGVAIDREARTADRQGRRLWSELRAWADFTVDLVPVAPLEGGERAFVELLLGWERATGLRLGRRKSAGLGAFEFDWERAAPAPAPATRPPAPAGAEPRHYLVHVEALEPLRLAGSPRRAFFRDHLDSVPATTLRGALGWALARRGDGDTAHDLFVARPVRLSAAVVGEERPPGGWLGRLECRADPSHGSDLTLDLVDGAVRGGEHAGRPAGCPRCGAGRKRAIPMRPDHLVIGQVEIDRWSGRARDQRLFYQATIRPGTRFTAELVARPEQAEALGGLGEVLVGGNRARGLGRARVRVVPAPPLPPVAERVAATVAALRRRALHLDGDEIAVLGLVTDGWAAEPLRPLLGRRGLEVVAARLATVPSGGYDEQAGRPRPLRRLLARGSWVAVRGGGIAAAVEELERDGVDDPAGLQPLWLRARDDMEGMADGD